MRINILDFISRPYRSSAAYKMGMKGFPGKYIYRSQTISFIYSTSHGWQAQS
jgi:hypothetical protein